MDLLLGQAIWAFETFLLVFVRMTGIFMMSPIFGRRNIPAYTKVGLSLLLSYIIYSYGFFMVEIEATSFAHFGVMIFKEVIIGFGMGFVTTLIFSAIWTAGQIIDTQLGFGIVNVIDPQSSTQIPLIGNFKNILALLTFFILDGHHTLIKLIFASYDIIPLGRAIITEELSMVMVKLFADSFVLSFKIALPIVATSFISEVAFGILVRTVPQMNIFIIGIPFKILIGLIALLISIPAYIAFLNGTFQGMFRDVGNVMEGMVPK